MVMSVWVGDGDAVQTGYARYRLRSWLGVGRQTTCLVGLF